MKKGFTGFTIFEVLVAIAILAGALVGALSLNIYCINLQDNAHSTTLALNQVRAKMEEIRGASFASIISTYNNQNLALAGLNGRMYITASYGLNQDGSANTDLINVRVIAGWAQRTGQIVGEGMRNPGGEFIFNDSLPYGNGNGQLESPLYLQSAIARKS